MNSKIEALQNVTPLEKIVLTALVGLLYAEPGFSDVTVSDIAKSLGHGILLEGCGKSVKSVRGVIGSLTKKGLVNSYVVFPNDEEKHFIRLREEHHGLHPVWGGDSEAVEVPEAPAPEADAPEADAPEAPAPEADAPEAAAPESVEVPEADAPEADAPEAVERASRLAFAVRSYETIMECFRVLGVTPAQARKELDGSGPKVAKAPKASGATTSKARVLAFYSEAHSVAEAVASLSDINRATVQTVSGDMAAAGLLLRLGRGHYIAASAFDSLTADEQADLTAAPALSTPALSTPAKAPRGPKKEAEAKAPVEAFSAAAAASEGFVSGRSAARKVRTFEA